MKRITNSRLAGRIIAMLLAFIFVASSVFTGNITTVSAKAPGGPGSNWDDKNKPYDQGDDQNDNNNYEKQEQADPYAQSTGIQFVYTAADQVDDTVTADYVNQVKFTIDLVDQNDNSLDASITAQKLQGATISDITFTDSLVTIDASTFSDIKIDGYTFDEAYAFFYWEGKYQGTKRAVTSFQNFGKLSTAYPGYISYIGFTTAEDKGNDYTGDTAGYYAYNPTGTLRVVFKEATEQNPYKTVYMNGEETLSTETDTVESTKVKNGKKVTTQYTYKPVAYSGTTPVREGYEFLGWSTVKGADGYGLAANLVKDNFYDNSVNSDCYLYATYKAIPQYTVTVKYVTMDEAGNKTEIADAKTLTGYEGTKETFASPAVTGYTLTDEKQTEVEAVVEDDNTEIYVYYTQNNYTIRFLNYDESVLSEVINYHYGDTVKVPTVVPTKAADETYTYSFAGWDKDVVNVTEDADYTATFAGTPIKYEVIFKAGDTVLQDRFYQYGATVTYDGATPVKAEDATCTHEFLGWDKEIVPVTGNTTYVALFSDVYKDYTVTFLDADRSQISQTTYHYGDKIKIPADPTKAADATYTYKFAGWDKPVAETCDGNATYTATYDAEHIEYTVSFLMDDGKTVIATDKYYYGDKISVPTATKTAACGISYVFDYWTENDVQATVDATASRNVTYVASFYKKVIIGYYTLKVPQNTLEDFRDQKTIQGYSSSDYYTVVYATLSRDQVTLELEKALQAVYKKEAGSTRYGSHEQAEIQAVVKETSSLLTGKIVPDVWYVIKLEGSVWHIDGGNYNKYTVTFKDEKGENVISSKCDYLYGDTLQVPEKEPTKEADSTKFYKFAGWDANGDGVVDELPQTVTANATYQAVFNEITRQYTVTYVVDDVTIDTVLVDAGTPVANLLNKDYTPVGGRSFSGWSTEVTSETVLADVTVIGTTEEIPTEEETSEDVSDEEESSENVSDEESSEDFSDEEESSEDASDEEENSEDVSDEDESSEDVSDEEKSSEDASDEVTTDEAVTEEVSTEGIVSEEEPTEEATVEEAASEDVVIEISEEEVTTTEPAVTEEDTTEEDITIAEDTDNDDTEAEEVTSDQAVSEESTDTEETISEEETTKKGEVEADEDVIDSSDDTEDTEEETAEDTSEDSTKKGEVEADTEDLGTGDINYGWLISLMGASLIAAAAALTKKKLDSADEE